MDRDQRNHSNATRAITFTFAHSPRGKWSVTYPVGTEQQRLDMVAELLRKFAVRGLGGEVEKGDVLTAMNAQMTNVHIHGVLCQAIGFHYCVDAADLAGNGRLNFIQDDEGDRIPDDDDREDISVTFMVATREQKLKFGNWIAEDAMGAFGDNASGLQIRKTFLVGSDTKVTRSELKGIREATRTAMKEVSDALFDKKEEMSDGAFTSISNVLKRTFDQI